ncbi:unnamed protein product [Dicrocoelium dendriticum]|nr:unnamed protein product [Dicrocoelium dendriticum]
MDCTTTRSSATVPATHFHATSSHANCLFANNPHFRLPDSSVQQSGCDSGCSADQGVQPMALLCPRSSFRLACFNVRTLMQNGQQAGLARTLDSLDVDVCCLSETRLQDPSTVLTLTSPTDHEARYHLRLSGDPEAASAGLAGVGIALSGKAEAALLDWFPINSRLCAVRLRGSCRINRHREERRNLFVISVYAPTDCSGDSVKDDFYRDLHQLLTNAKKSDVVILAGDFNARVGRLLPYERHLGGHHALDENRSDNGERLLTLCEDNRLFLSSTSFRRTKKRCATWRPPSPTQPWSQIDHIAISFRWRGSVLDCRSFWSTFVDSDHALVCAKICMCFGGSRNTKHRKIDVNRLTDSSVQESYQSSLAYALSCNPPQEVEQHWTCIRKALTISGQSCCGLTRRPLKSWISARSLELFERRKDIPAKSDCNERRRSANRLLKQSLRKDRETWWSERALEMETAVLSGNTRRLFQLIRSTGLRKPGVSEVICEVDESPITNQQRRMDRWAEHFHSQFNWPPPSISTCSTPCCPPWLVPLNPPSEAEVCLEIRRLKRFKAAGLDGLPPELFKYGGVAIINQLTALFAKIWHEEKVPSSWGESVIVPIFKKGARTSCANHRGISLISVASKLLASILLRRLSPVRESYYREEQAGFRPGRGCVDQIFTLRQLLEHRHIYHRPTIVAFLDIRAAFDSVDRPALWRCLLKKGVPEKYTAILRALYLHTSGRVRVYGKLSSQFAVNSGVRQGCPMSPFLFNFAIEDVLSNALEGFQHFGLELLPGERATDLDYADDIALLGDDPQGMQLILDRLAVEASKYGMSFAPSKCKVLLKDWLSPAPVLTLQGAQLEQVDSFVYLGSCVSADGTINKEVSLRIAKARSAFVNLRHLWHRRDVSFSLKGRIYSASVRSVLLYGCESWPIRVEDMRRLSAFDNGCLRRIARVWWQHRVNSNDVRRRILGNASISFNKLVLLRQLRWLGHVLRMAPERLPRRALFARQGPGWKRLRGGQPSTWRQHMKSLTSCLAAVGSVRLPGWGPKDEECQWLRTLEDMARNRNQWKNCVQCCIDSHV